MAPKEAKGDGKKAKGPTLPPKPALFNDEAWAASHSVTKLLELLGSVEKAGSKDTSVASKATAALWLWQLLGASSESREEAFKAKAVEVCCKLLCTLGTEPACITSCCGCLAALARHSTDDEKAQATAACESIMAAKPPVVPFLLRQLDQAACCPGVVAAALGLLHALVSCAETRPLVGKVMAGWNWVPLMQALASQQKLPLLGGRNASADAAGIIQLLCAPPAPAGPGGAAADSSGSSSSPSKPGSAKDSGADKGDSSKAARSRATSASSSKGGLSSSVGAAAGGGSVAQAVQQAVLDAGGLQTLLRVCTAHGSTVGARCAAVAALQHLMASHGQQAATKETFGATGLCVMVQLMARAALPLPAKAAAAGCIYHYLAPSPATVVGAATATEQLATTPGVAGSGHASAAPSKPTTPLGAVRPGLATAAASHALITTVLKQRKETAAVAAGGGKTSVSGGADVGAAAAGSAGGGKSGSVPTRNSNGGGSGSRAAVSIQDVANIAASGPAGCAGAAGGVERDIELPPAPGDAAVAAQAAAQAALLAIWDEPLREELQESARRVVDVGAIPGLLVLCCGAELPPPALVRAADVAAAAAIAAMTPAPAVATDGAGDGSSSTASASAREGGGNSSPLTASTSNAAAAAAGASTGASSPPRVGDALDSIAEPSHASEGEEDDSPKARSGSGGRYISNDDATADAAAAGNSSGGSSRVTSASASGAKEAAGGGGGAGGGKKGKKGGKKMKGAAADPAAEEAQQWASGAVQLLAVSCDAARLALVKAGALPVLLPLLEGRASSARWHARQALLTLSLVTTAGTPHGAHAAAVGASTSHTTTDAGAATQYTLPQSSAASILPVKLPAYLSLASMPPSHWQLIAPLVMPPQPPMPYIPARSRNPDGGGSSGGARPGSQGRRTSVSNLSAGVTAASRVSSTSSYVEGTTGGAAAAAAATQSGGTGGTLPGGTTAGARAKGARTSMVMAATAAAATASLQAGAAPAAAGGLSRASMVSAGSTGGALPLVAAGAAAATARASTTG